MPKIPELPPTGALITRANAPNFRTVLNQVQGNLLIMENDPGTPISVTQKITIEQLVLLIHGTMDYYRANLSQTGINDPVETVLISTLNPIIWSRVGVGHYNGSLLGGFPLNRTFMLINNLGSNLATASQATVQRVDANTITVHTRAGKDLVFTDGLLKETSLQLLLY